MSSVPTWKRNLSRVEYLFQTYQLAIRVGQIVHNTASKYKDTYGSILIKNCERAIFHGRAAQNIYIKDDLTLDQRLYEIAQARAAVDNLATYTYIWFETIRRHDGISEKDFARFFDYEEEVGDKCNTIIKLLDGLKRSDKEHYKEYKKKHRNNSES